MKNHVLYISIDGLTDPLGQAQILPYVCGLSNRGFQFTLVSAENPRLYSEHRLRIERICTEFGICWKPVVYRNSPPIIGTIWMQKQMRKTALAAHKDLKFDLIHCRSYLATQLGSALSADWRIPILFDMRGLWADEKVEGGIWNIKNPLHYAFYRHFKKVEKSLFAQCSGFISLTYAALPELAKISGSALLKKPHEVIPCCTDTNHFDPERLEEIQLEALRKNLGIAKDTFVMTYLGSISTWYMPTEMCKLFKRLQLHKPDALFLIITREPAQQIEAIAESLEIDMKYIRVVPANRQELPSLLSLSTIAISFVRPSYSKIASSPTKMGEYLSMGIPVISNVGIGDTDKLFSHPEAGSLCREFNNDCYDACIKDVIEILKSYPKSAIRELGKSMFDLNMALERYERIYKNLIRQK
ncbi:MAG: glycosyltransferase [Sphingobacteriales bacterium]|nr:glycosyltransferase [Sphingobacteriales bacterium]